MRGLPETFGPSSRVASLSALFEPRSVIVVGASDNREIAGRRGHHQRMMGGKYPEAARRYLCKSRTYRRCLPV